MEKIKDVIEDSKEDITNYKKIVADSVTDNELITDSGVVIEELKVKLQRGLFESLLSVGPMKSMLLLAPQSVRDTATDWYRQYLINISSLVLGFTHGFSIYSEKKTTEEAIKQLINVHLNLLTPDRDGVALLRGSFLFGMYQTLDKTVDGLRNLSFLIADVLALESAKDKFSDDVLQIGRLLFTESSPKLGDHSDMLYGAGYLLAMQQTKTLEEALNDHKKMAVLLGKLGMQIAVEVLVDKGLFKVVSFNNKYYLKWVSRKKLPNLKVDAKTLKIFKEGGNPLLLKTAATGGIRKLRIETVKGGAIKVQYEGFIKPALTRTEKSARSRLKKKNVEAVTPIAPNFNEAGYAKKLKPKELGLKGSKWERAHVWGPGFGDEGAAGIWLAPEIVNQGLQNHILEGFARKLRKKVKPGDNVVVSVEATSMPTSKLPQKIVKNGELVKINHDEYKLGSVLESIEYTFRLNTKEGKLAEFSIGFSVKPEKIKKKYKLNNGKEAEVDELAGKLKIFEYKTAIPNHEPSNQLISVFHEMIDNAKYSSLFD